MFKKPMISKLFPDSIIDANGIVAIEAFVNRNVANDGVSRQTVDTSPLSVNIGEVNGRDI